MKPAAHVGVACEGIVHTRPFSSATHDFSSPCPPPPPPSKFFTVAAARSRLARPSFLRYTRLSANHNLSFSSVQIRRRNSTLPIFTHHLASNYSVNASSSDVDQTLPSSSQQDYAASLANSGDGTCMLSDIPDSQIDQTQCPDVKRELLMLALPALAGQAIDPLAQLMETAYIGRLGTVELASAGVSVSIFNIISKLFNIPLLSVATSFVAEDISMNASHDSTSDEDCEAQIINGKPLQKVPKQKQLSSVSTALLLAVGIGIVEALALYMGSGVFLSLMGIPMENPTRVPAQLFLSLRALGAPAVVLSLALQGIFRGFKDTKTPVICLGFGNLSALFLFPLLMYIFQMGVMGAAISTVISQYIVTLLMIWNLNKRVVLLPPKVGSLQFGSYIKSGGFLLGRTLAVLTTMTLGTSMAARQGPVAMAAHQICLQVWLAVSLLTDALAASGQAIIAGSLSRKDYKTVKEITGFVLKIGLLTGITLAAILGVTFGSMASFFTEDADVLQVVRSGALFVCASQPFNALAYIFDGLHYGISDFPYAACSMMMVGAASSVFLLYAPPVIGFPGVWLGLTLFMALRTVAGFVRLLSRSGPWWFLHRDLKASEMLH